VIVNTDTVVNPWTVMVKSFNAPVAYGAVLASRSSKDLAIRTHLTWVHF
jgi:hypothetical protein